MPSQKIGDLIVEIKAKVDDMHNKMGQVDNRVEKTKNRFADAAKFIGGAYVAGRIVNALKQMWHETIAYGVSIDKFAKQTGLAAEEVQKLAYAAEQEHGNLEALNKGLMNLTVRLGYAGDGLETYLRYFKALGIEYKNTDGTLRNTYDVFLDLADVVSKGKLSTEDLAATVQLFGARAGKELIPLLKKGRQYFEDMGKEAEDLGFILENETIKRIKEMSDATTALQYAVKGAKFELAEQFLPTVLGVTEGVTLMIKQLRKIGDEATGAEKANRLLSALLPWMETPEETKLELISKQMFELQKAGEGASPAFQMLKEEMRMVQREMGTLSDVTAPELIDKFKGLGDGAEGAAKGASALEIELKKLEEAIYGTKEDALRKKIAELKDLQSTLSGLAMVTPEVQENMLRGMEEQNIMLPKTLSYWENIQEQIKGVDFAMTKAGESLGLLVSGSDKWLETLLKGALQMGIMQLGGPAQPFLSGLLNVIGFGKGGINILKAAKGLATKVNRPTITQNLILTGEENRTEWILTPHLMTEVFRAAQPQFQIINQGNPEDVTVRRISRLSPGKKRELARILGEEVLPLIEGLDA